MAKKQSVSGVSSRKLAVQQQKSTGFKDISPPSKKEASLTNPVNSSATTSANVSYGFRKLAKMQERMEKASEKGKSTKPTALVTGSTSTAMKLATNRKKKHMPINKVERGKKRETIGEKFDNILKSYENEKAERAALNPPKLDVTQPKLITLAEHEDTSSETTKSNAATSSPSSEPIHPFTFDATTIGCSVQLSFAPASTEIFTYRQPRSGTTSRSIVGSTMNFNVDNIVGRFTKFTSGLQSPQETPAIPPTAFLKEPSIHNILPNIESLAQLGAKTPVLMNLGNLGTRYTALPAITQNSKLPTKLSVQAVPALPSNLANRSSEKAAVTTSASDAHHETQDSTSPPTEHELSRSLGPDSGLAAYSDTGFGAAMLPHFCEVPKTEERHHRATEFWCHGQVQGSLPSTSTALAEDVLDERPDFSPVVGPQDDNDVDHLLTEDNEYVGDLIVSVPAAQQLAGTSSTMIRSLIVGDSPSKNDQHGTKSLIREGSPSGESEQSIKRRCTSSTTLNMSVQSKTPVNDVSPDSTSNSSPTISMRDNSVSLWRKDIMMEAYVGNKMPSDPTSDSSSSEAFLRSSRISTAFSSAASQIQIGPFALTDFLETLLSTGNSSFTKQNIALAFLELSNEEREDLDLALHSIPDDISEVLNSKVAMKKIKMGNIRLGGFLSMIKFDENDIAASEAFSKAFRAASEKERIVLERVMPFISL